jgi:hypothetical protein
MNENWLHVSGEPSNWQITQAIRYYTSACLKALKYWRFSAFFLCARTEILTWKKRHTAIFTSILCIINEFEIKI